VATFTGFGTGLAPAAKLLLILILAALTWRGLQMLLLRETLAVRRLHLARDGCWQLQDARLQTHYVQPVGSAREFGPLLWLRFRSADQYFPVLIDTRFAEPRGVCALKGLLRLHGLRTGTVR
jgi:hypothetical protein